MNIIEIRGLTKYYGKTRGIENLDLSVGEGEVFGFIGPNGAGKSTTIRTLLSLLRPTSGQAKIFGLDVLTRGKEIRKNVGYLPSEVEYYAKMKVSDLLHYSARFYGANSSNWLTELVDEFKLDIRKRIDDLSTGNRKKVAIIQCLLHRPRLLVLDEPTMGLDPLMQEKFFKVLRKVNEQGTTIFFSSHVLQEVEKVCNRVSIIKEGSILETEDIDAIRAKHFLKVQAIFADNLEAGEWHLDGVISSEVKNGAANLQFDGDINQLIGALQKRNLRHLTITEPSLEEVFLHYYE